MLGRVQTGFQCAGCGEWNDTDVDETAGRRQQYVEDCQICCKPNVIAARWDPQVETFVLQAQLE